MDNKEEMDGGEMGVVYDNNGNIKQNRLYLANPQKKYIGVLAGARNLKFTENFNNMHELSFDIYEKLNGVNTEYYDAIENKRLIHAENIGWFQVIRMNKKKDDSTLETYKTVQCLSIENELIGKRIDNINGVFALYDVSDTAHSILHLAAQYSGWTIAHVDNELLSLYRVFASDTEQIYNFLTTTVSKSFECVFIFNSYDRSISAYKLDNIGDLTNIVISKRNVLNEYEEESVSDYIVTKMRVKGADGVDIRAVNFGYDYITNVSYYKIPTSEPNGWMTQGLVDAINNYNSAVESYQSGYTTLLQSYKTKQAELNTLNSELTELQSQQKAQDIIWQPLAQQYNGTPPVGTPAYTTYINAKNSSDSFYAPIATKKEQITSKQAEIDSVQSQLDAIGSALDENNFFTSDQMKEYGTFLTETDEYQDSTFVVTDTMTQAEVIDLKLQLLDNAKKELAIKAQPQYTITIKASNLFTIQDDDSPVPYSEWIEQFKVGNLITLKFRDDYWVTSRLISMTIDFNNLQDLELKFSNKNRLDNELVRFAETLADAGRTSSSLDYNFLGFKDASSQTNEVRQFMTSNLNATLNAIQNDDKVETLIDQYGIHMREWSDDQNKYLDNQMWISRNVILFTDDGWNSSKMGVGQFTNTNGDKFYGVIADVIVGNFVLTSALTISNQNNTITMNKDGAIFNNCSITINKGVNTLTLNATDGIKLTKSGVSQFYIDGSGDLSIAGKIIGGSINIGSNRFVVDSNGLVTINSNGLIVNSTNFTLTSNGTLSATNGTFSGTITSTSGTIGGWIIGSNSFTSNGNSTININNGSNKSMIIDYNGLTLYNKNIANSHYGDITAVWDGNSAGGIMLSQGLNATHIAIGYNTSSNTYNTAMLFSSNGFSSPIYGTVAAGFSFYRAVNISSTLKVNNNTVIHQGNYNSLGLVYPTNGSTHTHDTLYDNGYELNWAGSSCLFAWSGQDLGQSAYRWGGLYLSSAPNVSSDRNLKHDIETLPDIYKTIILKLRPVRFKYNDGSSDRYHTGFISQELEEVMDSLGIDSKDFAAFIKAPIYSVVDDNGMYDTSSEITGYIYMLRHEELISPIVDLLQEQKNKIDNLENRLNIIESKL